eukprot:788865-Pelagomonas_calceolata.AAC.2
MPGGNGRIVPLVSQTYYALEKTVEERPKVPRRASSIPLPRVQTAMPLGLLCHIPGTWRTLKTLYQLLQICAASHWPEAFTKDQNPHGMCTLVPFWSIKPRPPILELPGTNITKQPSQVGTACLWHRCNSQRSSTGSC